MRAVEEEVMFASRSDSKVLITGESGVGKEVVARLIHHRGLRNRGPLLTINCAGVPDSLLASELFGHVRGSFTDAYTDKRGWLEQAHGGTIFMDEVGEMSSHMQGLLLRFLENGEIQRVGSDRRRTVVDVRVITATNRRLIDCVASKDFREDLYYRLNVIHIDVPPLRERPEDIQLLLEYFIKHFSVKHGVEIREVSEDVVDRLTAYLWPGNVRQLRNVAEGLVIRSRNGVITAAELPRDLFTAALDATFQVKAGQPPRTRAELLFDRMVSGGESFWVVVYQPFMERDITREDLQAVIRRGLELTRGNYKNLLSLFNLPQLDHKRLINFLRKYQSHIPIQRLQSVPAVLDEHRAVRAAVGE